MSERRTFFVVFALLVLLVVALLLWPEVREGLAPSLDTAWVAIEIEGSGEAVVGTVEIPVGTPFRLHAVLEATHRDGSKLYYTEAPALRLPDGPVPAEALRRWDRSPEIKVLWFTVEGAIPYLELEAGETLERFRMTEFLRPDWPQAWSIPGSLDPANDDRLVRTGARTDNPFGTQRYHVRIELYGRGSALVPEERYRSWEAAEVRRHGRDFPSVVAALPGPIGPASALFGLTQIEPPPDGDREMVRELRELTDARLAFTRLTALRTVLASAGKRMEELDWRLVSLDGELAWGEGAGAEDEAEADVAPGDLVRVGDRVVVLYEDQGRTGLLDRQDLCFDYARGAAVRVLGDVFIGGGEVELGPLSE